MRPDAPDARGLAAKLTTVLRDEFGALRLRRSLVLGAMRCLPPMVGNRVRARFVRLAGIEVGAGTVIGGAMTVVGPPGGRLTIGRNCWINSGTHVDVSADVTIGDGVAVAQDVMLLTSSHVIGPPARRAGPSLTAPVVIGDGAWLGARVVVLPGVTVGPGAIVAAGAVVAGDVDPNTIVGGVPARAIRSIDD